MLDATNRFLTKSLFMAVVKVFSHVAYSKLRPRSHEAETGETVTVSIYPVSKYLRKDEAKRNRVDL